MPASAVVPYSEAMDVRIGVSNTARELEVEMADDTDVDALTKKVDSAATKEEGVLWLTDRRGKRIGVPTAHLAYVEIDAGSEGRRVGFGAANR